MPQAKLIKKMEAKVVNLGTKVITKYTASDRNLEINHMTISGRHPENVEHFIFETACHFMVYIMKGEGKIYCDDEVFEVTQGDVVDVPINTRFAAEGENFEYITVETPAWYPQQASIVDKDGNVIEQTKV